MDAFLKLADQVVQQAYLPAKETKHMAAEVEGWLKHGEAAKPKDTGIVTKHVAAPRAFRAIIQLWRFDF